MWTQSGNNKFPVNGWLADSSDPQFCLFDKYGENVFFKQIRLAINERRKAIRKKIPHPGISDADWNAQWADVQSTDYVDSDSQLVTIDNLHAEILKLGKYFCLISEDFDGIIRLDSLENVVKSSAEMESYAAVDNSDWKIGGVCAAGPNVGDYGWTIIPARLNPNASESIFAKNFADYRDFLYDANIPIFLSAEIFNEMFRALNMMVLLSPSGSVDVQNYYGESSETLEGDPPPDPSCSLCATQVNAAVAALAFMANDTDDPNDLQLIRAEATSYDGETTVTLATCDQTRSSALSGFDLIYDSDDGISFERHIYRNFPGQLSMSAADTHCECIDGGQFKSCSSYGAKFSRCFFKLQDFEYENDSEKFYP